MLAPLMALLSLITALASVLSLAAPVFRDAARSRGADLRMVFMDATTNGMQFIIVNEGRSAAVAREAWLTTDATHDHRGEVDADAQSLQWHLLPETSSSSQKYIKPGETALMTLRVDGGYGHFPKLLSTASLDRKLAPNEWVLSLMVEAIQTDGKSLTIGDIGFVGFNAWDR